SKPLSADSRGRRILMRFTQRLTLAIVGATAAAGAGLVAAGPAHAASGPHSSFIGRFHRPSLVACTVPANRAVTPSGVGVVPRSQGRLHRGDILVSDFNNSKNLQGTGTTIVEISPSGHRTLFAHITKASVRGRCPGGVGLTTALVLVHGWVIVGSLPSRNGQAATSSAGCLVVLDSHGSVRTTFKGHGINGPWDATAVSHGRFAALFVTNVLNGTVAAKGRTVRRGTVLRLDLALSRSRPPAIRSVTKVGSG